MIAARGLRRELITRLEGAGIASAASEARWLIEHVAGRSWASLSATGSLDPVEAARATALAERRAAGEPLQYVLGTAPFRDLDLEVGPGVFIPRPETELVAGAAIGSLVPQGRVLDLCTGSGAIALAIAHERPDAIVVATDIDAGALMWADKNRAKLGVDIDLRQGDLFVPLDASKPERFDVVVANPPYVTTMERASLPGDVVDYEPEAALFAGVDGLAVIERIVAEAPRWLVSGGYLVLEIGSSQRAPVERLFRGSLFRSVTVRPDLASMDRIAIAQAP